MISLATAIRIQSSRRWRATAAGIGASVLLAGFSVLLAGCWGDSADGPEEGGRASTTTEPADEQVLTQRSGDLDGTIRVTPERVEPGGSVRITTRNRGREALYYGLSSVVERLSDGEWKQAFPPGPVLDVGLSADRGERAGPRYGQVVDEIELPADLEPGFYRVIKHAGPSLDGLDRLTLGARFTIHPSPRDLPPEAGKLWGATFASTAATEAGERRRLVPGTRVELSFGEAGSDRRGVGWEAGCNLFGSKVVVAADHLLVDERTGTSMACTGPLQDQDEWIGDFLESNPSWELSDGLLTLSAGETVVELERTRGRTAPHR